ncbi:C45 family autoproteolytic acyltransferase/hydolase [Nocardiopsis aegyptia]|uniref:Isopenicillin-N N-acyltransferase-like protein n=1 Tax=Nocardiopsis aegyptia TaxID=220378 RepID=A0A7Z0JDZ2_9ACTN|nr:C45 family peptidase [Nocardiopsis aegyptia]NYJ38010.1 isopenicillin-N N-acyltransferase-like protein [Nocardiopsis aegyptia]
MGAPHTPSTGLPLVEVSGGPHERGLAHGSAAQPQIRAALEFYERAFDQQTGLSWGGVLDRARGWLPACRDFDADLVTEMAGIAEGAGVDPLDVLALNVRGEIIYDSTFNGMATDTATDERDAADGCTSFALAEGATGDGHVYAGQNWDWRHGTKDTVVMLRVVQPPRPTLVMQVEAGQVGRHGANSAGIALNANGLGGRFGAVTGIPQTLIRRRVLDSARLTDALDVLLRTRAHIASNALLTHRSGYAIDVETTPGPCQWMYPDDEGLLVHGNHYQAGVPPQLADDYRPISSDSLVRVPRARRGLRAVRRAHTTDAVRKSVREAMSDHLGHPESLCTHPDPAAPEVRQWATVLSSLVDLTSGEYLVAAGNPCEHDFTPVPWNLYDGPGGDR